MRDFLRQRWFLVLLAAVLITGFSAHAALDPLADRAPQRAIVAATLFLMALPLDISTMWGALRRPGPVALAVAINLGLLPLVAWGITPLLRDDLAHGLLVAASIPCTLASAAVWTRRAGGNDAVAIVVTMVTNLACFVVTPAWLWLTTARDVDPQLFHGMVGDLAWQVVAPIVAAQLLRLYAPLGYWASRRKTPLGVVAQFGILTMVFVGAVKSGEKLAASGGDEVVLWSDWAAMIASVVALHLSMLAAGHLLGRWCGLARPDRIAVGFAGSQKTLMVGLHVAIGRFGGLAMLPMVAYHIGQLLLDTLVADRLRRNA